MVVALSLLYLCLAGYFAYLLVDQLDPSAASRDLLSDCLAWVVLAATLFFFPFHLVGFLELAAGFPLISAAAGCVVLGTALAGFLVWRRTNKNGRLDNSRSPYPSLSGWKPELSIGSIMIGLLLLGTVFMAVTRATGYPIGAEGLAYHLPIGVHMFQSGSLRIWDTAYMHTYPANHSLYLGFLLGLFPEKLVAAANVPFLICFAGAMFGLGRTVTRDFNAIALMTIGVASMPIVMRSSELIESDLGGLAFLAIAVFFAFGPAAFGRNRPILAGLAAGIAFGFKSLHLVGLIAVAALLLVPKQSGESSSHRAGPSLRLFGWASLVMSSFWLVRNYVQLGNPLYPVFVPEVFPLLGWTSPLDISLLGRLETQTLWVDAGWQWLLFPWRERPEVLLGPFFVFALPASLIVAAHHAVGKGRFQRVAVGSMLLASLFLIAVWWLLGDRQPRYCLGALVFLGPLIAWMMARLSARVRVLFEAVGATSILLALSLALVPTALDLVRRTVLTDQSERHRFYQYPEAVDDLPAGSVIVNLGFDHQDPGNHRTRAWNYPLAGKLLRNRVVSFSEAVLLFAAVPSDTENAPSYRLDAVRLRKLGATHVWMIGNLDVSLEKGLSLSEVGRLDENPVMATPLDEPRVLYKIGYP